jgi:hypothetical protein
MSSPSVSSDNFESDPKAFKANAAIFSSAILKLAWEKRTKFEETDPVKVAECATFINHWYDFEEFGKNFNLEGYAQDYGSIDKDRRLNIVIVCSSFFEKVYETMVEVDAKRDTWRFPDWLGDDEDALMARFYELRQDWYNARLKLCGLLGLLPNQGVGWNLDISPIICSDRIRTLPSSISISNSETGGSSRISLIGDRYSKETSMEDATLESTTDDITMALNKLASSKIG